jgi:subtilisin family serine protease
MSNKNAWLGALCLLSIAAVAAHALESIVTSSGFRHESSSPITVIDKEMIGDTGLADINELIGRVPGVTGTGTSQDGTAKVYLRGLGTDRTLTLVNGVRVTSPGVSLDNIPADVIERIEVLKGPQGTISGRNATGGAINIVTQRDFQPFNTGGSYTLGDIKYRLSPYWISLESNEECDATHGSPMPWWSMTPGVDNVQPKVSEDGELFSWGTLGGDFRSPSKSLFGLYSYRYEDEPSYNDSWYIGNWNSALGLNLKYDALDALRERIRSAPNVNEQDKRDFIWRLVFSHAWLGPGSLSDSAVRTGDFDPEKTFQDFLDFSRTRTEEDRTWWNQMFDSATFDPYADLTPSGSSPSQPEPPAPAEPPVQAEQPAQPATPVAPADDRYFYDARFDLEKCDNVVKDKNGKTQRARLAQYLVDRLQARADWAARADYLLSDWERELNEARGETVAEAEQRRNDLNRKINAEWGDCQNGITTPPDLVATTAPEPGSAPQAAQPASDDGDDIGANLGAGLGLRFSDKWNLRLHVEYPDRGADAPSGPVKGIAGDLSKIGYRFQFPMPFAPGATPQYDLDAQKGSGRAFSDDTGTITFPGGIGGWRQDDEDDKDFSLGLGASFNFDRFKSGLGKDWSMYYYRDTENRYGGPTLGLRYSYSPIDSLYVETVPDFSTRGGLGLDEPTGNGTGVTGFASDALSIGKKNFFAFDYSQYQPINPDMLKGIPGMTYSANNECGDSALPPEGSGYLTAEESTVKSVADQWALEHVGLVGDEPSLDEFAKPVIIAVIDTGLDWHHLDFSWDNLWRNEDEIPENGVDDDGNGYVDDVIGWSFVENHNYPWDSDGHGTFVAGVIAATQGNDAGIDGINGHARIMVLKALNDFGRTRATHVAKAIVYAADNGAQLVNLSVTGPGFPKIVQDAVDYATEKGALVVNAAGNKAEDMDVAHPDALRGVLTVAATDADDNRAVFSNVGSAITIAAPGVDVVSLRARATDFMYNSAETRYVREDAFLGEDRRYYRGTGTSFATPIVTGVASLLLSRNPALEPADLVRILEQSARDVGAAGRDRFTGYGVVDAKAALAADPEFFIYADIMAAESLQENGQDYLQVIGLADAQDYAAARLEIGQGDDPGSWTAVGASLAGPVRFAELARIPTAMLTSGGNWTIRLTVEHANGRSREARFHVEL